MTFDEAMTHAKAGRRVTHPGLNVGWSMKWEGKSALYVSPDGRAMACKIDDREKTRTDWELVK